MKTMLTRSGSTVSRYSVASVDVGSECSEIVRRAVAAVRTAPRGSRPGSLQDMEASLLHEIECGRPVSLERVLRMVLIGKRCGADVSDVASAFAEILAPETEALPASLADAIDAETQAQCECDPIEIRLLTRNGTESPADCDRLISGFRRHRDTIGAAIKVVTRRKFHLLRSGVHA